MQCYEVESLLIDYLDAQMHPGDKKLIEQHLQHCPRCVEILEEYRMLFAAINNDKAVKPGPVVREKFENMLRSEIDIDITAKLVDMDKKKPAPRVAKMPSIVWKIAASIILIASGVFTGAVLTSHSSSNADVADLKTEVKEMKETLLFNLLGEESASDRIKAVGYAGEINQPDDKIVAALITTMNDDKNVNVRLAALYAVAKFSDERGISDALIASLGKQTEPLMQIALINILTEKKESKAKQPIREILQDKNTLPPVKEIAQKGLRLL